MGLRGKRERRMEEDKEIGTWDEEEQDVKAIDTESQQQCREKQFTRKFIVCTVCAGCIFITNLFVSIELYCIDVYLCLCEYIKAYDFVCIHIHIDICVNEHICVAALQYIDQN